MKKTVLSSKLAGGIIVIDVIAGLSTSSAMAAVAGDTINGTLAFGSNGARGGQHWSPSSITDPGAFNYSDGANVDSATFSGNNLTITDHVISNANGFQMTFTDVTHAFTELSLVSSSFSPNLTYSFSGGTAKIDWIGTSTAGSLTAVFNVAAGAVPEPATWVMMLVGMGTIGFAARRRQNTSLTYA